MTITMKVVWPSWVSWVPRGRSQLGVTRSLTCTRLSPSASRPYPWALLSVPQPSIVNNSPSTTIRVSIPPSTSRYVIPCMWPATSNYRSIEPGTPVARKRVSPGVVPGRGRNGSFTLPRCPVGRLRQRREPHFRTPLGSGGPSHPITERVHRMITRSSICVYVKTIKVHWSFHDIDLSYLFPPP
jgi:hypothetical protein